MRAVLKELVASGATRRPSIIFRTGPDDQRSNDKPGLMVDNDARTGMPFGIPKGAICVQRFDDSLNSAIRITYRISLRSSSLREPRYPLLRVVLCFVMNFFSVKSKKQFSSKFKRLFKLLIKCNLNTL